jgi:hypothetical protein
VVFRPLLNSGLGFRKNFTVRSENVTSDIDIEFIVTSCNVMSKYFAQMSGIMKSIFVID